MEESEETPSSLLLLEQEQRSFSTRPDVDLALAKQVLLQLLCKPRRPPSGPRALEAIEFLVMLGCFGSSLGGLGGLSTAACRSSAALAAALRAAPVRCGAMEVVDNAVRIWCVKRCC